MNDSIRQSSEEEMGQYKQAIAILEFNNGGFQRIRQWTGEQYRSWGSV